MRPYKYFKTIAKMRLTGKYIKCIVAFLFVTLLTNLLTILPGKINLDMYQYLIFSIPSYLILIPCFRMGAIGIVFNSLENKDAPFGNLFDGFKYIFKLIPIFITKLISFVPLFITGVFFYKFASDDLIKGIIEYSSHPDQNTLDSLSLILENNSLFITMVEMFFVLSMVISIIVSCYIALSEYILYNENTSGIKAVIKSIKLMRGHILYYIGFNLSFILWHIAASFTYGLSTLILNPYKEAAFIIFYNYLRFAEGEDISTVSDEPIKEE